MIWLPIGGIGTARGQTQLPCREKSKRCVNILVCLLYTTGMKTETQAVVYFSKYGTTKLGAELLAERLGITQIFPLLEKRARRGFIGFIINGFQATRKAAVKIDTGFLPALADVQHIYLMTPIWASSSTPAVNGFLGSADLSGKTVTIVTFQADPEHKNSERTHTYLRGRIESMGGRVDSSIALHGSSPGKYAGEEHVAGQIEKAVASLKSSNPPQ